MVQRLTCNLQLRSMQIAQASLAQAITYIQQLPTLTLGLTLILIFGL